MELKTIIIYVHHYYCDSLLYKLMHNTNSKELYINDNKIGYVLCKYKNILIKLVFNPTIHDATDGYHLIDFYTTDPISSKH
jgi:predicted S18 family serine protease